MNRHTNLPGRELSGIFGMLISETDPLIKKEFVKCATTRICQAAVSSYENCYIKVPEGYIQYKPDDIRKMTINEIEAVGEWFILKEESVF